MLTRSKLDRIICYSIFSTTRQNRYVLFSARNPDLSAILVGFQPLSKQDFQLKLSWAPALRYCPHVPQEAWLTALTHGKGTKSLLSLSSRFHVCFSACSKGEVFQNLLLIAG